MVYVLSKFWCEILIRISFLFSVCGFFLVFSILCVCVDLWFWQDDRVIVCTGFYFFVFLFVTCEMCSLNLQFEFCYSYCGIVILFGYNFCLFCCFFNSVAFLSDLLFSVLFLFWFNVFLNFGFNFCMNASTMKGCYNLTILVVIIVLALTIVKMVLNNGSIQFFFFNFSISIQFSKLSNSYFFCFYLLCFSICDSLVRLFLSFVCSVCICVFLILIFNFMFCQIGLNWKFRNMNLKPDLIIFHQVWWWVVVVVCFIKMVAVSGCHKKIDNGFIFIHITLVLFL